jgi:hypothetical protein
MAGGTEPMSRTSRILNALEVLAKLVGASAVVVVAVFANSLQSRLTGVSIQSQREQAESQLRAGMFSSLIGPLGGPEKDGKPMAADREVLLTELLALNFNENFEMKPLMEHAVQRINEEYLVKPGGDDPREPVWQILRRISERQKAAISMEWSAYRATQSARMWPFNYILGPRRVEASSKGCEVVSIIVDSKLEQHGEPLSIDANCQASVAFRDVIHIRSVDGNYTLQLAAVKPNWIDQKVKVSAQPFLSSQSKPKATDPSYNFELSWLDLPLTDNTILPDGNRFAVYLRSVYNETLMINVMWFPKGYFTPRERPLNYSEVQELLGRTSQ